MTSFESGFKHGIFQVTAGPGTSTFVARFKRIDFVVEFEGKRLSCRRANLKSRFLAAGLDQVAPGHRGDVMKFGNKLAVRRLLRSTNTLIFSW